MNWLKKQYRRAAGLPATHADEWREIEERRQKADAVISQMLLFRAGVRQRRGQDA